MTKLINLVILALVMLPVFARGEPPAKEEVDVIFVGGGVRKPGRYDWVKGMTVLDAIQAAGGLIDPSVPTLRITITHADHTKVVYPFSPKADPGKKPPSLQAGDRVFVPKNVQVPSVALPPPKPAK